MAGQRLLFGDEHIGKTVSVEINESEIRIASIAVQLRGEGPKRLPTIDAVAFVEAGGRPIPHNEIDLTVARQIHELRCPTGKRRVWPGADHFHRSKFRAGARNSIRPLLEIKRRKIAFVEPAVSVFAEYS